MTKKLPTVTTTPKVNVPMLVAQALPTLLDTGREVVQSLNRRAEIECQTSAELALMAADRETVRELHYQMVESADLLTVEQRGQLVTAMVHVAVHGSRRGHDG